MKEPLFTIVGFTGVRDERGIHIVYIMGTVTSNKLMKSDEKKAYFGEFPADLCAGKQLIFIYKYKFEY